MEPKKINQNYFSDILNSRKKMQNQLFQILFQLIHPILKHILIQYKYYKKHIKLLKTQFKQINLLLQMFLKQNIIVVQVVQQVLYLHLQINSNKYFAPEQQTRVYTIDFSIENSKSINFFEGQDGVWSFNFIFYNVVKNRALLFVLKATEYESVSETGYSQNNSILFNANDDAKYNEISQDQISEFSGNKYVFI